MTLPKISNKRERLVDAAQTLLHKQGYNQTTLSDIADASGVPLGNVYYYFKTKDDIAAAVIENRRKEFAAHYQQWQEQEPDPIERLKRLLAFASSIAQSVTDNGCPVGSLCQELNKEHSHLSDLSGQVLADQVTWVESQFRLLDRTDADQLARRFVAQLQGSILLANSLKDSSLLLEQITSLQQWLLSLATLKGK